VKNADFRTDHPAEHQKNLVAINTKERVKCAEINTKNADKLRVKNEKKRLENALPEPSSKCRSYPYGPLARASIVAYYTQKDKLKLPQIDQILGRFPPQPLLHGLCHKYGGDAALCNLRKAIIADEDSRLLDAIAASGLSAHPPAGKRMRISFKCGFN
jgi:hypothetical protein